MSWPEIYPIIIPEFCGDRPVLEVLAATLRGGARLVQLRDKISSGRYAADFRQLTSSFGARFIVNDSVESALASKADGIHIGQGDVALVEARRRAPGLTIGVSVNNLAEAKLAQENGASYVTLGVAFPTETKTDVKVVTGLEFIRQAVPALKIPSAAIGGINLNNIDQVLATGVKYIAVASAITRAPDVEKATRELIARCARI